MSDAQKAVFAQIGDLLPFRQESDAIAFREAVENAFPGNVDDTADTEDVTDNEDENKTEHVKAPVGKTPVVASKK